MRGSAQDGTQLAFQQSQDGLDLGVGLLGGEVTVTGLLTGRDIAEQLAGEELGETLYLPRTTLRSEGDLFLCGMSTDELSQKLGVTIEFSENDGAEFVLKLLGLE